jgi:ankyrin repeat protein
VGIFCQGNLVRTQPVQHNPTDSLATFANTAVGTSLKPFLAQPISTVPSLSLMQLPLEMLVHMCSFLEVASVLTFLTTCKAARDIYTAGEREGLRLEKYYLVLQKEPQQYEETTQLSRYYQFILSKLLNPDLNDRECRGLAALTEKFFIHFNRNEIKSYANQVFSKQSNANWVVIFDRLARANLHLCVTLITSASPAFEPKEEDYRKLLVCKKVQYPFTEYYSLLADKLQFSDAPPNTPYLRSYTENIIIQDNIELAPARAQQFFRHIRFIKHDHNTVLHFAVLHNYMDIVPALVASHGINLVDDAGTTALSAVCEKRRLSRHPSSLSSPHIKVIQALLALNADPNIQNEAKNTALIYASRREDFAALQILLDHGAQVNLQNKLGKTALFESDQIPIMELLLKYGANVNHQDILQNTILILKSDTRVAYGGYQESVAVITLLLKHGAAVNLQNKFGVTALMHASRQGSMVVMRLLLAHRADIHLKDNKGLTALDYARQAGQLEAEQLLLAYRSRAL